MGEGLFMGIKGKRCCTYVVVKGVLERGDEGRMGSCVPAAKGG